MKNLQDKRKDAMFRLERRQAQDEAKVAELTHDLKILSKQPDGELIVKHGLLAGFSFGSQKECLEEHREMIQKKVLRRAKEIQHLRFVIAGVKPFSVQYS